MDYGSTEEAQRGKDLARIACEETNVKSIRVPVESWGAKQTIVPVAVYDLETDRFFLEIGGKDKGHEEAAASYLYRVLSRAPEQSH